MSENRERNPASTETPYPGILVSDYFPRQPYGYRVNRPSGTRDWLITFTLSGSGVYTLHSKSWVCSKGDVVILSPGTPHHYAANEPGWEFVWAHFVPESAWSELLRLPQISEGLVFMTIELDSLRKRLLDSFQRLIRESGETDYYQEQFSLNMMEEILLLLARYNAHINTHRMDPRIVETLQYLNQHMKKPHTIEDLANLVALSPSRFAHLFKQQVGDSVIETLLKLRLRHASRLLEHTTMRISEIAEDAGFNNPYYFSKQFTRFFGMSPTTYRKFRNPTTKDREFIL